MEKIQIQNIQADSRNIMIKAIVIAKSEYKTFESRLEVNGVMRITLRDSDAGTANVTIWDSEAALKQLDTDVDVGTLVEVTDPRVAPIRDQDHQFAPEVSCKFSLVVTTNSTSPQGKIAVIRSRDASTEHFGRLLKLPNKPMSALLSLKDANQCGLRSMEDCDQSVDLLVVVRAVRPPRDIFLTKKQTTKQYREVVVMDRSFAGMSIKFWGDANIRRTNSWCKGTVLFLANVRVSFCKYSKATFLNVSGRTVMIEEPAVREADELRQLAISVPVGEMDFLSSVSNAVPDVSTINTVMSVQQIFDRVSNASDNAPFTALCYALVSKFDLDGFNKIYRKICVHCRSYMKFFADYCEKPECIDKFTAGNSSHLVELIYDIEVGISDHTGTLTCRLTGKHAETLLRCTVEEFLLMPDGDKAALKWQYLLERCAVKLVVKRKSAEFYKNMITIVECVLADPNEVADRIQMY